MRLILLPAVAAAILGMPALPDHAARSIPADCIDRFEQVRDAAGRPRVDRSPAVPGEGYLIAAVDKRIDGCAVMQMHGDVNDLRPVPRPTLGPARLLPAR